MGMLEDRHLERRVKEKSIGMGMLGDGHLLPIDIIAFEILVRLPVVDVIRCTSICKQWYSIIKTPRFISTHLSLSSSSSSRSQPSIFVHHYSFTQKRRVLSSHFDLQTLDEDCHTIPFPIPLPWFFTILGPIHGLFCLFNDGISGHISDKLCCLWNPSVRRHIRLPPPPTPRFKAKMMSRIACGFGFDDVSKDYKVVLLAYLTEIGGFSETLNCQLLSVKQGTWSTLGANGETKYCYASGNGLFVNGALHWAATKYSNEDRFCTWILAFDVARETFKKIELPQELRQGAHKYSILETKGSFACFEYPDEDEDEDDLIPGKERINRYGIWVMKEYGRANSWVRMWTFALTNTLSWVYGVWGIGDEILIQKEDNFGRKALSVYNTKAQESKDFGGDTDPCISRICSFTESLILLDKESQDANVSLMVEEYQSEDKGDTKRRKIIH